MPPGLGRLTGLQLDRSRVTISGRERDGSPHSGTKRRLPDGRRPVGDLARVGIGYERFAQPSTNWRTFRIIKPQQQIIRYIERIQVWIQI
jgi:hypothetical protein